MQRFFYLLFTFFIIQTSFLNAQINTPPTATIPFGTNTTYPGTNIFPTNLPTSGTYGNSQDAADAYNDWKTAYVESCGGTNPEVFRVKFDTPSETVSEGIAYGMLLAAYAADKALFDGLWQYYKNFSNGNGVMNWKINGCSSAIGTGGATDAELDAAMALLVANYQWQGTTTPHDYAADATALITAIKNFEIQPTTANGPYQTNNGDQWGFGNDCRNPSYQAPAYYKCYGEFLPAEATFWGNCVNASYTLINANAHPTTGFVSNWSDPNGNSNSCNGPNEYGWDACRNPWRMGKDVAWYNDSNAKALCNKIAAYVQSTGASSLAGPCAQDGSGGSFHSPTFISTWATGVMGADASYQSTLNSVYTETVNVMDSPPFYFGNTLRAISLFMMTGNFWKPAEGDGLPVVNIISPNDNQTLDLTTTTISIFASDANGTITNVEVQVDGQTFTATNTSGNNYEINWTPSGTGTYTITVTATDNENNTTTQTITVTVANLQAPEIEILSPNDGETIMNGAINLYATATDTDGTISNVTFMVEGQTLTASNTTDSYYSATWNTGSTGLVEIIATTTDNDGLMTSDTITINLTQAPSSGITASMNISSDWGNGFCADLVITNNTGSDINGWTFNFDIDADVYDMWNTTWTDNGNNNYSATNISWNGNIPDGGSLTSIGFCAHYTTFPGNPYNATLNGIPVSFDGVGGGSCAVNQFITTDYGSGDGAQLFEVSDFITAVNDVNIGGGVECSAANFITLEAGFEAKAGSNFWAYILGCTASKNNNQSSTLQLSSQLKCSPNPAMNILNVSFLTTTSNQKTTIYWTDVEGRILMKKEVFFTEKNNNFTLDTSNFGAGVYFLNVVTDKEVHSQKVVVMH